jgi:hypothetical protein
MQVDHITLVLRLAISNHVLWRHLPASAEKVGRELAAMVDAYRREHELGYYPAIEFFRQVESFDQNLIDDTERIAWAVTRLAREQIQSRLRPVFSTVRFRAIQTEAFSLPPVLPGQPASYERLIGHYTPNRLKLELQVSLLSKEGDGRRDAMQGYARKMIYRWLSDIFDEVEIKASAPAPR